MTEIVRYTGLRKSVHGRLLFDIELLSIHERTCVALSGKNGAGKSTLLRILAGLEAPDSATVSYQGKTTNWRRASGRMRGHVIYLHQQPYLFDASVIDNIAYGLHRRGLPLREISSKVSEALTWAGIGHLQLRNARDLSVVYGKILRIDPPTSSMDSESRAQAFRMIKLLKDEGVSIIVATHEYHTLAHLCDEHLLLQAGRLQPQPTGPAGGERKIIPYG